jgi:hypothetical protein
MNIQRIAWFMLMVLLSQQSLATVRIIASNVGTTPINGACSEHHHHSVSHAMQHCEEAGVSSSHTIFISDHSNGHGNHCENCVSGCQLVAFLSTNIQPTIDSLADSIGLYSPFIPWAPSYSLYRPPITV